jgi:hypothetical protein
MLAQYGVHRNLGYNNLREQEIAILAPALQQLTGLHLL